MIFDEIVEMLERDGRSAEKLAELFDRDRRYIYSLKNHCTYDNTFRCDYKFIWGLHKLGYDLKLVKRS